LKKTVRILALGDVVGSEASLYVAQSIAKLKGEYSADAIIINAENSSDKNGVDRDSVEDFLFRGADVITTGNHVYKHKSTANFLDECDYIIRPANYPADMAGRGYLYVNVEGFRILVVNLLGQTYISDETLSPFITLENILLRQKGNYDACIVDFHAEATSEKIALAMAFDGRVSAVFGTHTHVQTADERILKRGTGFVTDIGMCGPRDSILGVKSDIIINRFYGTDLTAKFVFEKGNIAGHGILFDIDTGNKSCILIQRICF